MDKRENHQWYDAGWVGESKEAREARLEGLRKREAGRKKAALRVKGYMLKDVPDKDYGQADRGHWSKADQLRLIESRRLENDKWRSIARHEELKQGNREAERRLEKSVEDECLDAAEQIFQAKGIEASAIQKKIVGEIYYLAFYGTNETNKLRAAEDLAKIDGRLGLKERAAESVREEVEEEGVLSTADMVRGMMSDPEFRAELERQMKGGEVEDEGEEDTG